MIFPSIPFAYFFLIVLTVVWSIRRHRTYQKLFLLVSSYFFYAGLNWKLFVLLLLSSLFNWGIGEVLFKTTEQTNKKRVLWAGLGINLVFLGFFKYYNFFTASFANVVGWLGLDIHLPLLEVLMPLGISFFTFQGMSYIVDVYKGEAYRPHSVWDFLLFISFFPQLIAGPICRSTELLPQLAAEAPKEPPEMARAATLIFSGLFKKMVLASYLSASLVDNAFLAPENHTAAALWVTTFAYSIQIYLDFSGYTDLARGLGLMMGFELPKNFNGPYAATNIGDYWRRWHMSFSRWLRLYIYFPLGGSRVARWRCYTNLMITFVLCGLWHGAHERFIVWGFLHGVGLVVYKWSVDVRRDYGIDPKKTNSPFVWLFLGWFVTFMYCILVRVFFCSADFVTALSFFGRLFDFAAPGRGFAPLTLIVACFGLAINFVGRQMFDKFVSLYERCPALARPLVWAIVFIVLLAVKPATMAPYIYFRY
ncbi:MAG: alginate O-acetyltransferase [Deltaproteobacteria bacterium]|nr:alginate O-acetyltransferase [Deltaproteobacteria bacterium]MBU54190.1 alginate O-acetyltransferase [Deltaproteobacteria bacterium]